MASQDVTLNINARDNASAALNAVTKALKAMAAVAAATAAAMVAAGNEASKNATTFARLRQSVEGSGKAWSQASRQVNALFQELERTTRFGAGEAAQTLDRLVRLTGDYSGSVKNLGLVFDVAEGSGKGVEESLNLVAKAMTSNLEALGEVLPEARELSKQLGANATAAEKADAAIRLLIGTHQDAAKAIDPLRLAQARLANESGNLVIAFGDLVRDSRIVEEVYLAILSVVEPLTTAIDNNRGAFDGLGDTVQSVAKVSFSVFTEMLLRLAEGTAEAFAVLTEVTKTLLKPLTSLMELLFQLGAIEERISFDSFLDSASMGLVQLAGSIKLVREDFDKLTAAAGSSAVVDLTDGKGDRRLSRRRRPGRPDAPTKTKRPKGDPGPLQTEGGVTLSSIIAGFAEAQRVADAVDAEMTQSALDRQLLRIDGWLAEGEAVRQFHDMHRQAAVDVQAAWEDTFANAIMTAGMTVLTTLGDELGRFAVTGEFSFKRLGLASLGAIGDMMVQMGTYVILTSKALNFLSGLAFPAALGVGIALAGAGAVLKGSVGALAGKGGGGGAVAPPPDLTSFRDRAAQRDRDAGSRSFVFNVNTQGGDDDSVLPAFARMMQRAFVTGRVTLEELPT